MEKLQVVKNIEKLMDFWRISINDLSKKTGISIPGLKKMFKSGSFKVENLEKIAKVLNVPTMVLLAVEITIFQQYFKEDTPNVVIKWFGGFYNAIRTEIFGKPGMLWVEHDTETKYIKDQPKDLVDQYQYTKSLLEDERLNNIDQRNEIKQLKKHLESQNELIDFMRKENFFAYSNLINILLKNRQKKDGAIDPDSLSDIVKSKIFDETFMNMLLEKKLISKDDYLFFRSLKTDQPNADDNT